MVAGEQAGVPLPSPSPARPGSRRGRRAVGVGRLAVAPARKRAELEQVGAVGASVLRDSPRSNSRWARKSRTQRLEAGRELGASGSVFGVAVATRDLFDAPGPPPTGACSRSPQVQQADQRGRVAAGLDRRVELVERQPDDLDPLVVLGLARDVVELGRQEQVALLGREPGAGVEPVELAPVAGRLADLLGQLALRALQGVSPSLSSLPAGSSSSAASSTGSRGWRTSRGPCRRGRRSRPSRGGRPPAGCPSSRPGTRRCPCGRRRSAPCGSASRRSA